jgi:hypothetical protein
MTANAKDSRCPQLFSLAEQKAGFQAHANGEADGLGVVVNTDAGRRRAVSRVSGRRAGGVVGKAHARTQSGPRALDVAKSLPWPA